MALDYSEKVMEHFSNPRNVGEIENADGVGEAGNPRCGDIMKIYLKVKDNVIEDVKFKTFGCASAIASSSMATELIKGKTIDEAWNLTNNAVAEALEIGVGDDVHHLRRLLTADSVPMAIEENWVPAGLLPDLLKGALPFSVYAELTERGLAPQWGEDMIEGRAATAEEAVLLGVTERAPSLDITRRTFHDHLAVDYSRSLYRADRYTLWVPVAAPGPRRRRPRASRGA